VLEPGSRHEGDGEAVPELAQLHQPHLRQEQQWSDRQRKNGQTANGKLKLQIVDVFSVTRLGKISTFGLLFT